jgi:hypothetical protein
MKKYLPGEIAYVCDNYFRKAAEEGEEYADYYAKMYEWSESVTTVQFNHEGKTREERPRCLWLDSKDENGEVATPVKGWTIRLPDFRKNNQTYEAWEEDPSQMCDWASRFNAYEEINEYMCPEIFETAPEAGQVLPDDYVERPACFPNVYVGVDETPYTDICDDERIPWEERIEVATKFRKEGECAHVDESRRPPSDDSHPIDNRRAKRQHRSQRANQPKQKRSSSKSTRQPKKKLSERFVGQLVKSRDPVSFTTTLKAKALANEDFSATKCPGTLRKQKVSRAELVFPP